MAVAAVEARDPANSLRFPARWIAYILAAIELTSVFSFVLNVGWTDTQLPGLTNRQTPSSNSTTPLMIIAVKDAGMNPMSGFLNVCLILVVLSAANTALYGECSLAVGLEL